jgi:glutamate N-acetyltransferase/amino-acid N-acetyltransferase
MLAPELATMLVVLMTDAAAGPRTLAAALAAACADTFETLDADGCSSTNDTVLLLASGAGRPAGAESPTAVLQPVCADLAGQLAADAEGATRTIGVVVRGAADRADPLTVARAVDVTPDPLRLAPPLIVSRPELARFTGALPGLLEAARRPAGRPAETG